MKEINFQVNLDEANLILEGLGHIPFARVYPLVAKIQEQARQQLNGDNPKGKETESSEPALSIKK